MTESLPAKAQQLLDATNLVALTTLNADGSPQTTPVWVGRDAVSTEGPKKAQLARSAHGSSAPRLAELHPVTTRT